MRRLILIVGVAAIAVAILAIYVASTGLFGVYRTATQSPAPTPAREIEVELYDYYFEPSNITISVGETVRLVLKNEGKATHTFTIDELGINVRVAPGETKIVEITPNKTASYMFYCIPHRAIGMVGNLTIVSAPGYTPRYS